MRAGEHDWIGTWRAMAEASNAALVQPAGEDRWAGRAGYFDRFSRREGAANPLIEALAPLLCPSDVVLDVGAGTGRHVIPLARRCRRVIAVEPSAAMRGHLERRIREEALTNVEILAEAWPPPAARAAADVALSSHVIYGIADVEPFLRAMDAASRRLSVLSLGVRAPADAFAWLWTGVHGAPRPRRPGALEALALLHQIGLHASFAILPGSEQPMRFTTSDEDLAELCHRVSIAPTPDNLRRIGALLAAHGPADAGGARVIGTAGPNALVSWSKT